MTSDEEVAEPSIIVPTPKCPHSRYESRFFHDIRKELLEALQRHSHFDPERLHRSCREDGTLYYFGPDLSKEAKQKTLPDDNRRTDGLHEYAISAFRDRKLPPDQNPLAFLAKGFKQYVKVNYWNGRHFIIKYNLKGEFLKFKLGVWEHDETMFEHWKKEMIPEEEFMRLTRKYLSPEHFYRGSSSAEHHASHTTNIEYIVNSFLGRGLGD